MIKYYEVFASKIQYFCCASSKIISATVYRKCIKRIQIINSHTGHHGLMSMFHLVPKFMTLFACFTSQAVNACGLIGKYGFSITWASNIKPIYQIHNNIQLYRWKINKLNLVKSQTLMNYYFSAFLKRYSYP